MFIKALALKESHDALGLLPTSVCSACAVRSCEAWGVGHQGCMTTREGQEDGHRQCQGTVETDRAVQLNGQHQEKQHMQFVRAIALAIAPVSSLKKVLGAAVWYYSHQLILQIWPHRAVCSNHQTLYSLMPTRIASALVAICTTMITH